MRKQKKQPERVAYTFISRYYGIPKETRLYVHERLYQTISPKQSPYSIWMTWINAGYIAGSQALNLFGTPERTSIPGIIREFHGLPRYAWAREYFTSIDYGRGIVTSSRYGSPYGSLYWDEWKYPPDFMCEPMKWPEPRWLLCG